jgi:hypothetical protein
VDAPAWPPPPVPAAPNEGLLGNPRAPAAALPLAGATKGPLARSGRFGRGLNIDLLELGPLQVIGPGGVSSGVVGGIGLEIDLGARLALRLPLKVGGASASGTTDADGTVQSRSFVEVAFAPSVLYRFRDRPGQRWIPFVVAGLDAGIFQFGRQLVGLSPSPKGTAQEFVRAGAAPKGAVGLLYNPTRLFGLRLTAEYTYFFIANASVHTIAETIAARFSF